MQLLKFAPKDASSEEIELPTDHPILSATWQSDYGDGVEASTQTDGNALPQIALSKFDEDGTLLHRLDYERTGMRIVTFQLWFLKITACAKVDAGGLTLKITRADECETKGRILGFIKRPWRMRKPRLPSS